ncbi:hypothetical protein OHC33_006662 [Knufia fluminis]|uniref:Aldehyde dehydrogenase domain-containing protein n=1 Tax=Knufia fluminis TaxID=191047 RepID=A0AAN8I4V2_9EURO|nr:hypothetical protein OHC33_006662 [Knufia fluminis]
MPFINEPETKTVPLWINGRPSKTSSPITFPLISSASGDTIHHAISATEEDAIRACDASLEAFKSWRQTTYAHRRQILYKAVEVLRRRTNEIAAHQVAETSCSQQFAMFNVTGAIDYMEEIASATSEVRGQIAQRPSKPDGTETEGLSLIITEPVGPVLIIPPWNGAIVLPARGISMALAAGCTIVLKASEKCPMTHHCLVEAFEEAGVLPGVINSIQVRREDAAAVTETIIAHKAIRKVEFIGSQAVGRSIGSLCGKYLKPVLMELGGKGPAIVLDDADLRKAATLCAMGATLNHGQLCFSTERIIVQSSIASKFIPLLKTAMLHIPPPGNAVDAASAAHAHDILIDAQSNGATFLFGSPKYTGRNTLQPALLTDVTPTSRIYDEETFGPSATVYIVDTDEDAIERANDSAYGLNAAVHSGSWERAYNVARRLEYGQVNVNAMTVANNGTQPIRGVKGSGWGQAGSIWGIREFVVEKTINMG